MTRPWKPDLYVVARFLDRLGDGTPWTKGKLQPAVRLNYDLFVRYLDYLEAKSLVERRHAGRLETFVLTPAGHELRRRLIQWIRQVFDAI